MSSSVAQIVDFLDPFLRIESIEDASLNGLQVEASSEVTRLGVAVDAAAATIAAAAERQCELLLVHHGLLFGGPRQLRGALGRSVGSCFRTGVSLYAAHLPLDAHPELGNNVLLAAALDAVPEGGFGRHGDIELGVLARLSPPRSLATVAGALAAAGCDDQLMWAFGPDPVARLGIVTGSGCSLLGEAVAAGADCFITGEPRQSAYHAAREAGVNCIFAGHYATEVFGIKALGRFVAERFGLELVWIDHPTGV